MASRLRGAVPGVSAALVVVGRSSGDGLVVRPWHPFTKASPARMPAAEAAGIDVEIFPTAAVIRAGHRLRVSIPTADFPHLVPPLPQLAHSAGPGPRIHHDAADPSWIALPVAP